MAKSPASILFDADGNPVGVVQDGTIYRLQVGAKLDPDSPTLLDNYERLNEILLELRKISYLLEHIADEKANTFDLEGN